MIHTRKFERRKFYTRKITIRKAPQAPCLYRTFSTRRSRSSWNTNDTFGK